MISIITPVYNAEKTILNTIESVIEQTFKEWELILIDDFSKDKSVDIILKYVSINPQIKLIKNKFNQGVAKSRNTGLQQAKFKLVAFLDADDYYAPTKLEIFMSYVKANPKTAIFFSSYFRFNGKGIISKTLVPKKTSFNKLLYTNDIMTSTVLINKNNTNDFLFTKYYHEDFVCWLELTKKYGSAIGISDYLTYYRVHENTLSSNKFKSSQKVYIIYRQFLKKNIIQTYYYMFFYFVFGVKKHLFNKFF